MTLRYTKRHDLADVGKKKKGSEAESVFVNKREKAGKEECDVLFFHHFSKAPQGKCIHHLPFN